MPTVAAQATVGVLRKVVAAHAPEVQGLHVAGGANK
jgi:hypothetical protein